LVSGATAVERILRQRTEQAERLQAKVDPAALATLRNDTDHTLAQALRTFGAAGKEDEGFEILHRHAYLELP
jgi:hypothetical protein